VVQPQSPVRSGAGPAVPRSQELAGAAWPAWIRKSGDVAFFAFLQLSALARFIASGRLLDDGQVLQAAAIASTGLVLLLMALLFLAKRPVVGRRASRSDFLAAMVGSWTIVPLGWLPLTWKADGALLTSTLLNTLAAMGVLYALTRLGRSFAVLPEARKLVTSGPYRFVRHPIYTLHIVTMFGTMLPRLGVVAAALFVVGVTGEVLRARNEERALREAFPDYEAYQARTKRFLPWLY
jgi:protein-S-isoprenylcysteine O-methyltransferase Ste14